MAAAGVPVAHRAPRLRLRPRLERLPDGLRMPRALGISSPTTRARSSGSRTSRARPRSGRSPRYERAAFLLGRLAASPASPSAATSVRSTSRSTPTCTAGSPGRWSPADGRRRVAPPARRGRLRREPARPVARGGPAGGGVRRRADGPADPELARRRQPQQPAPRRRPSARSCSSTTGSGSPARSVSTSASCWWARSSSAAAAPRIWPRATPCLSAYARGLADEGMGIAEGVVRRAHALQLWLFGGLSAAVEQLDPAPGDETSASPGRAPPSRGTPSTSSTPPPEPARHSRTSDSRIWTKSSGGSSGRPSPTRRPRRPGRRR